MSAVSQGSYNLIKFRNSYTHERRVQFSWWPGNLGSARTSYMKVHHFVAFLGVLVSLATTSPALSSHSKA